MCKKPTRRKLFQSSPVERGKRGAGERRRKEQIDNGKKGEGGPPLLSSCPPSFASCALQRVNRGD